MRPPSPAASVAWKLAAALAGELKSEFIEKEHFLAGILALDEALALPEMKHLPESVMSSVRSEAALLHSVLSEFKLDPRLLLSQLRKKMRAGNFRHKEPVIHRSEECRKIFEKAEELSGASSYLTSLHLLAAILDTPGDSIAALFKESASDISSIRERLLRVETKEEKADVKQKVHDGEKKAAVSDTSYLDRFGRDLTKEAKEGRLGPIIGRRDELLQIIQILGRRQKNNPVLVGEAGVGKTAIVEALAIRVVQGKDPAVLSGKRIVELNMGSLTSGTKYRGEFEERIDGILKEAIAHPEIIIFIDEIHTIVGAGRGEGSLDAANIMKPALARGGFKCIGATTIDEYRRYIESDGALERRFEKVMVKEPDRVEAIQILNGLRPKQEEHYNLKIADKALEAAVDLSMRFDRDHLLPDKAIDLVERACSAMQIPALSLLPGIKRTVDSDDRQQTVTEAEIAKALSEKTGVPLELISGTLKGSQAERILRLGDFIKARIIGQDDAVDKICKRIRLAHTSLGRKTGPLAVFLFLGPTGVGKTEAAKLIAEHLFGKQSSMIRIDMSEFMEEHSVAKLIGSPPGYVGHNEEGQLTGPIRTNPYSLILLDEVEKAHQKVFDIFLQLFDEGRLTDSKGKTADARNVIFVLTSNIAAHVEGKVGFRKRQDNETNSMIAAELRKVFRPELVNRIDEIVLFDHLSEDDVMRVLDGQISELVERVRRENNASVDITTEAKRFVVQQGYSREFGVRELRRTVERLLMHPMVTLMLQGKLGQGSSWRVDVQDNEIVIEPTL